MNPRGNNMSYSDIKFSDLKGKVLVDVKASDDNITFVTLEGESFDMYHDQDCCEHVRIESVVGDWKDLLGHPLLMAEDASNRDNPTDYEQESAESYTWTFYKLATIKGYVDIRWLGESNGYYSESVSFYKGQDYHPERVLELIVKNGLKMPGIQNQSVDKVVKDIYTNKKTTRFNL